MNKLGLEKRLNALEHTHRHGMTVEQMSDNELCRIIGIAAPTDKQLMQIIEAEV